MRIVELKSQSTKIIYKPAQETLKVGDFVSLTENELTVIAQVYKILSSDAADDFNQADLVFVLTHKYDTTKVWQGELVSADAVAEKTPAAIIEGYYSQHDMVMPFIIGKSLSYSMPWTFDFKKFQTPAFIGYEKVEDNLGLLNNLSVLFNQLNEKLFIFDYKGNVELDNAKKILAGCQAKLPLTSVMIDKLSSKILEGVSIDSKTVIEDILTELTQYAEEANMGFIPISNLIQTIDDFYKKSKMAPLILLKNKLSYFKKLNIFADSIREVRALYSAIEEYNVVIIDLSNIQADWQNEFLINLIEPDRNISKNFYIYLAIDSRNFDNNILNYLLFKAEANGIKPIISANYRHLAFDSIFDFSKNTFLFKTYNALKKRSVLSDILQTLPPSCYILTGKLTSDLVLSLSLDNHYNPDEIIADEINNEIRESKNLGSLNSAMENQPSIAIKNPAEFVNTQINPTPDTTVPVEEDYNLSEEEMGIYDNSDMLDTDNELKVAEDNTEPVRVSEPPVQTIDVEEPHHDMDIEQQASRIGIPIEPGRPQQSEEIIEIKMPPKSESMPEEDALDYVDSDDSLFEEVQADDNLEDIEDLDFLNDSPQPVNNNVQANNYSEDDEELLDLIEESDEVEVAPQKLPVYEANYQQPEPAYVPVDLNEGDLVKHNKYGIGTIKKITTHGDKVLCHINFDNFGRRLLDPEISQLQKIS